MQPRVSCSVAPDTSWPGTFPELVGSVVGQGAFPGGFRPGLASLSRHAGLESGDVGSGADLSDSDITLGTSGSSSVG